MVTLLNFVSTQAHIAAAVLYLNCVSMMLVLCYVLFWNTILFNSFYLL